MNQADAAQGQKGVGHMDMSINKAMQVLNPERQEWYNNIETFNKACLMGIAALDRDAARSPYTNGDIYILSCPRCGNREYLHNVDGNPNRFCGQCGQAIDWSGDDE